MKDKYISTKIILLPLIIFLILSACSSSPDFKSNLSGDEKASHLAQANELSRETAYNLDDASSRLFAADPTILNVDGVYYMYPTTNNREYHAYVSRDRVNWSPPVKVYEDPDGREGLWAPDVFHYKGGDGKFYLYYTVDQTVGVAVADSPLGPFEKVTDLFDRAIDAMMFEDDKGKLYLYYTGLPSVSNGWSNVIMMSQMHSPVRTWALPRRLLIPDSEWDEHGHDINEAPWMIKHDGLYYLMFSGSRGDMNEYAIGYAVSDNPRGDFVKYEGNPILSHKDGIFGPGHNGLFADEDGQLWIVYHEKSSPETTWGQRFVSMRKIMFDEKGILTIEKGEGK